MPTKLEAEPVDIEIPVAAPSAAPAAVVTPTVTKAFDMADYFARREKESKEGGDAGLLPLKPKAAKDPMDEEGMRQRLLAGANAKGMGARELQEELSGQLAGVSCYHWTELTMNRCRTSSSLMRCNLAVVLRTRRVFYRARRTSSNVSSISRGWPLLTPTENLDGTLKSKGNLDQVSRKGRSTTCMQLGIMVTVFIIFVWTYMLIRFT